MSTFEKKSSAQLSARGTDTAPKQYVIQGNSPVLFEEVLKNIRDAGLDKVHTRVSLIVVDINPS